MTTKRKQMPFPIAAGSSLSWTDLSVTFEEGTECVLEHWAANKFWLVSVFLNFSFLTQSDGLLSRMFSFKYWEACSQKGAYAKCRP